MTQERSRRITEWPLTIIAFVFLVAYAWEIIDELDGPVEQVVDNVIWVTWLVFL